MSKSTKSDSKPSAWTHVLTADELEQRRALTAGLDPSFARREHEFYQSRTPDQLSVLAHQAWLCNAADAYQLARSYAALSGATP